jgi:hypothetical protein
MKYFLFLFLLAACGESPLWNHANEKFKNIGDILSQESNGYTFVNSNTLFTLTWNKGPQVGESEIHLKAWTAQGGTPQGPYQDFADELSAEPWMPDMGHGSGAPPKISRIAEGEYLISKIYFIMKGKWELRFKLKHQGQVVDEAVVTLNI